MFPLKDTSNLVFYGVQLAFEQLLVIRCHERNDTQNERCNGFADL